MKLGRGIVVILLMTCCSQAALGLFDQIESRQSIGEHVAHNKGLVENFPDGGTDCFSQSNYSSGMSFPEVDGCWHYRSRYIVGELLWVPAGIIGVDYPSMKIFSLLVALTEIVLIFSFISKYFGRIEGQKAALAYSTVPAFIYYAQAPFIGHFRVIAVLLIARFAIPHFSRDGSEEEELGGVWKFGAWALVVIGPGIDSLLAFAWAGFGLSLIILKTRGRKVSINAILAFFSSPVLWFIISNKVNDIFGYNNELSARFEARTDFSLFMDSDYYVAFIDSFTNQAGPLGLVLLILLFSDLKRYYDAGPEVFSAVVSLSSMLFFTLFVFQSTFIDCCPYFAYPVVALCSFGMAGFKLDARKNVLILSILLFTSFSSGLLLHSVENNYSERELQRYVIDNIDEEDGMVITDHNIARWNAYRWQIPGGTIHISEDYSAEEFKQLVVSAQPEHIILSNQSFHNVNASILENEGYCVTEIETDERIPPHWIDGWMSDVYPIRGIWKC